MLFLFSLNSLLSYFLMKIPLGLISLKMSILFRRMQKFAIYHFRNYGLTASDKQSGGTHIADALCLCHGIFLSLLKILLSLFSFQQCNYNVCVCVCLWMCMCVFIFLRTYWNVWVYELMFSTKFWIFSAIFFQVFCAHSLFPFWNSNTHSLDYLILFQVSLKCFHF